MKIDGIYLSNIVALLSSYQIGEEEPWVRQLEMFEQWVELDAVEAAPGAVEVVPGLSLLPRVVVVQELIQNPGLLIARRLETGFSIRSRCPVDSDRRLGD